jgi:hypothetical protein
LARYTVVLDAFVLAPVAPVDSLGHVAELGLYLDGLVQAILSCVHIEQTNAYHAHENNT